MAYTTGTVKLRNTGAGLNEFIYDTLDAVGDVDAAGYFSDGVSVHGMRIGDRVIVRQWATAVPAMTAAAKNAATLSAFTTCYVSGISTNAATVTQYNIGS